MINNSGKRLSRRMTHVISYLIRRLPESVEGKAVRDVPEVFLHHLQNLVAGP
jgi:hypothetical protein